MKDSSTKPTHTKPDVEKSKLELDMPPLQDMSRILKLLVDRATDGDAVKISNEEVIPERADVNPIVEQYICCAVGCKSLCS